MLINRKGLDNNLIECYRRYRRCESLTKLKLNEDRG